ncbi:MAG: hypothetical protein VX642_01915 [Bdellovibrionota bacterium]|nr:hypothetical protein [Bdellovibrionota bacterium]
MGQSSRIAIIGIGFFILIFSFQNCSVYTSSGREYIEENGLTVSSESCLENMASEDCQVSLNIEKTSGLSPVENESCSQYLSKENVEFFSNGSSQLRAFADLSSEEIKCMYSISDSKESLEHLICNVSDRYIDEVNFPQEELQPLYQSDLGRAFLIESQENEESCTLIAPKVGLLGAQCCISGHNENNRISFLQKISSEFVKNLR